MPDITLAISANHNPDDLRRLLASVGRQDGGVRTEVLIGGPVPPAEVSSMRNLLYRRATAPRVYFLDADCELPCDDFLLRAVKSTPLGTSTARGGFYRSAGGATLLQKAYNSAGNLWLAVHSEAGQALPVAGNFIVPKCFEPPEDFPFARSRSFGGEEIGLIHGLKTRGLDFHLDPELTVIHYPEVRAERFVRRARLHGGSARQRLRIRRMVRPLVKHFAREDFKVGLLVVGYVGVVWLSRLRGGRECPKP